MKNPKSNYIGDAWRLRRKRMIIKGIIAGAVILVVAFSIFFVKILNMKDDIDSEFSGSTEPTFTTREPSTESASTDDSSFESYPTQDTTEPGITTETTTEDTDVPLTTESTQYTTEPTPETDEEGNEVTTTTTISLLPDPQEPRESVLFPSKYPLQTVTHAQRDQSYSNMKHAVKKYIEEKDDARIGFYYINLSTKEAFGYNENAPFIVGSSIYLPLTMMFYDDVRADLRSPMTVVPFSQEYVAEGAYSEIAKMPEGKQYYLDQLAFLAMRDGDYVAMQMLLSHMGGTEATLERLSKMSLCIDYTAVENYVDYAGVQQSGSHRSSAYDLANYAELLYWRYMSYPESYQDLIDAMSLAEPNTGVGRNFPAGTTVLHRPGTSTEYHSKSDVAIILTSEPIILCVTVETEDPAAADEIEAALGALVYNFISYCHA